VLSGSDRFKELTRELHIKKLQLEVKTLETSGELLKIHPKRVENSEKYTRNEWRTLKKYTRNEWETTYKITLETSMLLV
jgi:hypothetical protein